MHLVVKCYELYMWHDDNFIHHEVDFLSLTESTRRRISFSGLRYQTSRKHRCFLSKLLFVFKEATFIDIVIRRLKSIDYVVTSGFK